MKLKFKKTDAMEKYIGFHEKDRIEFSDGETKDVPEEKAEQLLKDYPEFFTSLEDIKRAEREKKKEEERKKQEEKKKREQEKKAEKEKEKKEQEEKEKKAIENPPQDKMMRDKDAKTK